MQRKVDIYAPQIQSALADLFASSEPASLHILPRVAYTDDIPIGPAADLVKVHPGLKLSLPDLASAAASSVTFSVTLPSLSLPSLSGVVSDPFMSKSLFLVCNSHSFFTHVRILKHCIDSCGQHYPERILA